MRDLRLIVPEFDYKRKYGLVLQNIVDLLLKNGYLSRKVDDIQDIQEYFLCTGRTGIKNYELLDELASTCSYSTISVEKSKRSKLEIIRDLFYGLDGSDAQEMVRIILKQFKSDPYHRLHNVHPCALVIFRNQRDLFTLQNTLLEIDKKFTRIELQDKSKRIQAYREYGKPIVVIYEIYIKGNTDLYNGM